MFIVSDGGKPSPFTIERYFYFYYSHRSGHTHKLIREVGGSPGQVVMGGDSHSKGRGFKSQRRILDGHDIFSH